MHVTAIIAAGGRGQRLGGTAPKQLLRIGGRTILERSVDAFLLHPSIADLVVALPQELLADPPAYLVGRGKPMRLVAGGARRRDSVGSAFRAAPDRADVVVVHDAARPFASAALIARTIAAAAESGAALAALPASDTVKRARGGGTRAGSLVADLVVAETLSRDTIFLAQTPQAFRPEVLRAALALEGDATDEAALAERAGHAVRLVPGEPTNIKITTPDDLALARAIAGGGSAVRAGTGYDLHRLVDGRPLVLGGVTIPFDRGPLGHSDGDALCHAITDAVLGAVADGDIGRHFPDTDDRWKGASSLGLLRLAAQIVRQASHAILNVDATVILERPKLLPHIDAMRARVADALGIDGSRVSIKGKTNEGVGALGRGEAVAVHAIALLDTSGLDGRDAATLERPIS
jgi:2-C-methyl-D-erythritol 4-phosphate cytidylyltransferase/2-C-methyl-D-erythritol 2,4-cyclodiphosphate synthase